LRRWQRRQPRERRLQQPSQLDAVAGVPGHGRLQPAHLARGQPGHGPLPDRRQLSLRGRLLGVLRRPGLAHHGVQRDRPRGASGSGSSATQPPPVIVNPSPADGTVVTKPTPISAQFTPPAGQTIASWSVSYQELDALPPVTIASGTGSPPNPIATFDPTLLS